MSTWSDAGRVASAMICQLSKPTIATSSGTAMPALAQSVGDAARDLVVAAENRVRLRALAANSAATASRPQASDQTPGGRVCACAARPAVLQQPRE